MDLHHVKRLLCSVVTVAALALSAGCADDEGNEPAVPVAANPVSEGTPISIEEILVHKAGASDSAALEPLTPKDDIRVVLRTNAASESDAVEVKLFDIGNGREVGVRNAEFTSEKPGMAEVIFENGGDLSPGRYMIEIKVDGKLAGQRDVDIIDVPTGKVAGS